ELPQGALRDAEQPGYSLGRDEQGMREWFGGGRFDGLVRHARDSAPNSTRRGTFERIAPPWPAYRATRPVAERAPPPPPRAGPGSAPPAPPPPARGRARPRRPPLRREEETTVPCR